MSTFALKMETSLSSSKPMCSQLLCTFAPAECTLVWEEESKALVVLSQKDKDWKTMFKLTLTDPPYFVTSLVSTNVTSDLCLLSGRRGLVVARLPRANVLRRSIASNEDHELSCSSFGVAERLFISEPKLTNLQSMWHPGSRSHLAVLASNNYLRLYNVDADTQNPEFIINLTPKPTHSVVESTPVALRGRSGCVRVSLGETTTSFAFAPAADPDASEWPIFVLNGNGSVYVVNTRLNEQLHQEQPRPVGPLAIYPETEDNYAADFCSLLCLHPLISAPPVLVLATTSGILHHCVAMASTMDDNDTNAHDKLDSGWESNEVSLFVYESVELETGLPFLECSSEMAPNPLSSMSLTMDMSQPSRYFCSHPAGLHAITLPMVDHLAHLVTSAAVSELDDVAPSQVQHVVCTRATTSEPEAPLRGVCVIDDGPLYSTAILCLLNDGIIQSFNLDPVLLTMKLNSDGEESILGQHEGHMERRESFEARIRGLLTARDRMPKLKLNAATNHQDPSEWLHFLKSSTQVLREEWLSNLEEVRRALEDRVTNLTRRKYGQLRQLEAFKDRKRVLSESAAQLVEKYEKIQERDEDLRGRIETLFKVMRTSVTNDESLTDAEFNMKRKISAMKERTAPDLEDAVEQVMLKHKYQSRQLAKSLENDLSPYNRLHESAKVDLLNESQMKMIKELLHADAQMISDMRLKLDAARKALSVKHY